MCTTSLAVSCPVLVLGVQTFQPVKTTKAVLFLKTDHFFLGQREHAISQSLILQKGLGVSGVPQYNCLWQTGIHWTQEYFIRALTKPYLSRSEALFFFIFLPAVSSFASYLLFVEVSSTSWLSFIHAGFSLSCLSGSSEKCYF